MRLQKVSPPEGHGTKAERVYCGTQQGAKEARQEMVDKYGIKKMSVKVEEVEVPTKKEDLIAWINANAK